MNNESGFLQFRADWGAVERPAGPRLASGEARKVPVALFALARTAKVHVTRSARLVHRSPPG